MGIFQFLPWLWTAHFLVWFLFKLHESGFHWCFEQPSASLTVGYSKDWPSLDQVPCFFPWLWLCWQHHMMESTVCPKPLWRGLCSWSIWGGFPEECKKKVPGLPGQARATSKVSSKTRKWTYGHLLGRFRSDQTETQGMCQESHSELSFITLYRVGIHHPRMAQTWNHTGPWTSRVFYHSVHSILLDEQKPDINLPWLLFMREMNLCSGGALTLLASLSSASWLHDGAQSRV